MDCILSRARSGVYLHAHILAGTKEIGSLPCGMGGGGGSVGNYIVNYRPVTGRRGVSIVADRQLDFLVGLVKVGYHGITAAGKGYGVILAGVNKATAGSTDNSSRIFSVRTAVQVDPGP